MPDGAVFNGIDASNRQEKFIDTIDPDDVDYQRNLIRPATIKEDVNLMTQKQRVSYILKSEAFRKELEEIVQVQSQSTDVPGMNSSFLSLNHISEFFSSIPMKQTSGTGLVRGQRSGVIPVNDLRGGDATVYSRHERSLRCKLASVYRLVDLFGWNSNIFNHITARVSRNHEHFLINPFGLLYHEITASSLIKLDMKGQIIDPGSTILNVNQTTCGLHLVVHSIRADVRCIIHLDTPSCVAISCMKSGLLPLCYESMILGDVAYYNPTGEGRHWLGERVAISEVLTPNVNILFIRSLGLLALGGTIEEAFHYASNAVVACDTQAVGGNMNRRVIFDGVVKELNLDNFSFIRTVRLFLLEDVLITASSQSNQPNSTGYRLQAMYDMKNCSIVNVPDNKPNPLNAFRLSVFPASRMFQTEDSTNKELWIRLIEDVTKKCAIDSKPKSKVADVSSKSADSSNKKPTRRFYHIAKMIAGTVNLSAPKISPEVELVCSNSLSVVLPECAGLLSNDVGPSTQGAGVGERRNPFNDQKNEGVQGSLVNHSQISSGLRKLKSSNDWLWNVPEDLEVSVSERDFYRATQLVIKSRHYLNVILKDLEVSNVQRTRDAMSGVTKADWEKLRRRIEEKELHLTEALQAVLVNSANTHGASKTVADAVRFLGLLGKAHLASQLFLLYRSQIMAKALTHGVHQEADQLIYLNKLSFSFHRSLAEGAADWRRVVMNRLDEILQPDFKGAARSKFEHALNMRFCNWVLDETEKFGQQLRTLLIDGQSVSFYSMAQAATRMKAHSDKLTELLGVDISTIVERAMASAWHRAASDQAEVLSEAVQNRGKQEKLDTFGDLPAADRAKMIEELKSCDLLNKYSAENYECCITMRTYLLIRSLRQFIAGIRILNLPELDEILVECFLDMLKYEVNNYQKIMNKLDSLELNKRDVILNNLLFLDQSVATKFGQMLACTNRSKWAECRSQFSSMIRSIKQLQQE